MGNTFGWHDRIWQHPTWSRRRCQIVPVALGALSKTWSPVAVPTKNGRTYFRSLILSNIFRIWTLNKPIPRKSFYLLLTHASMVPLINWPRDHSHAHVNHSSFESSNTMRCQTWRRSHSQRGNWPLNSASGLGDGCTLDGLKINPDHQIVISSTKTTPNKLW